MKRVRDNTQKAVKSPKTNAFFFSFPKQAENARVCFDETHELIRRRRPKKSKKKKQKHKSNKLTKKETAREMKADPATGCSPKKKKKLKKKDKADEQKTQNFAKKRAKISCGSSEIRKILQQFCA